MMSKENKEIDGDIKKEKKLPPEDVKKKKKDDDVSDDDNTVKGILARYNKAREKQQKLEEELESYRSKEADAKEADLKKKGEFEKIISDLKPKAKLWDDYEATTKKKIEESLEKLPEHRREIVKSLVEKGDVVTADSLLQDFSSEEKKDAGGALPGGEKDTLSAEQIQEKLATASPQEYNKMKSEGLLDKFFPKK